MFTLFSDILFIFLIALIVPRIKVRGKMSPMVNMEVQKDELKEILNMDWKYKGVN